MNVFYNIQYGSDFTNIFICHKNSVIEPHWDNPLQSAYNEVLYEQNTDVWLKVNNALQILLLELTR